MGKPTREFPSEETEGPKGFAERKQAKRTMKSTVSPYEPFPAFYPLEQVIDAYMEIWYKDDSDSSSS